MHYFLEAIVNALRLIFGFSPEIYHVLFNSLWIAMTATTAAAIVAIPLAYAISLRLFPGHEIMTRILDSLMALPTVVIGLVLYGVLTRQGALGEFGLLYTPFAIIIGEAILIAPIITRLLISAMEQADPRMLATCSALGARGISQGFLLFSELRSGIFVAMIAGLGRAIGEVGVAMMVGGNIEGYTRTMTTAIALMTSKGDFEFALALGILLLLVAFLLNVTLRRISR